MRSNTLSPGNGNSRYTAATPGTPTGPQGRVITQAKLTLVQENKPISTTLTPYSQSRELVQAIPKFPSRKVDSKSQMKGEPVVDIQQQTLPPGMPRYFGTVAPNNPAYRNPNQTFKPPPSSIQPAVPRIHPVLDTKEFADNGGRFLNRTANGKILGNAGKRYISEGHIPHNPFDVTVGPDNLAVQIDDTWSKCWDREAGAVYYYNHITGEATWIQPDI